MASPESISASDFRKAHPEYDQSGQVQRMTAEEYATGKRAWDRPLVGDELTDEVRRFQPRVIAAFEANGYDSIYHTYNSQKCAPGFPDLVICREGLLFVAELKVLGRKPDTDQRRWLDHFAGGDNWLVFLWYPEDWGCIKRVANGGGCVAYDEPSRWVNRRDLYVRKGEK